VVTSNTPTNGNGYHELVESLTDTLAALPCTIKKHGNALKTANKHFSLSSSPNTQMSKRTTKANAPATADTTAATPGKAAKKGKTGGKPAAAATPNAEFQDMSYEDQIASIMDAYGLDEARAKATLKAMQGDEEQADAEDKAPEKHPDQITQWVKFFQLVENTFTESGKTRTRVPDMWTDLSIMYGVGYGGSAQLNPLDKDDQNKALWNFFMKFGFTVNLKALKPLRKSIQLDSTQYGTLATSGQASFEKQNQKYIEQEIKLRTEIEKEKIKNFDGTSPWELTTLIYEFINKINQTVSTSGITQEEAPWVEQWTLQLNNFISAIKTGIHVGPKHSSNFDQELVQEMLKVFHAHRNQVDPPDWSMENKDIKALYDEWVKLGSEQERKNRDRTRTRSRSRSPASKPAQPERAKSAPPTQRQRSRSPPPSGRPPAKNNGKTCKDERDAWRDKPKLGHKRDDDRERTRSRPTEEKQLETLERYHKEKCNESKRSSLAVCHQFNRPDKGRCKGDECPFHHVCSHCIYDKEVDLTKCYHRRCQEK
jgi:hypothetical protein